MDAVNRQLEMRAMRACGSPRKIRDGNMRSGPAGWEDYHVMESLRVVVD